VRVEENRRLIVADVVSKCGVGVVHLGAQASVVRASPEGGAGAVRRGLRCCGEKTDGRERQSRDGDDTQRTYWFHRAFLLRRRLPAHRNHASVRWSFVGLLSTPRSAALGAFGGGRASPGGAARSR